MRIGLFLVLVLVIAACSVVCLSQAPDTSKWTLVKFEIAVQPSSPIKLDITMQAGLSPQAMLGVRNTSKSALTALVLVVKAFPRSYIWTNLYEFHPISPGGGMTNGISIIFPDENKSEKPVVSVDYVEFADGTHWGPDTYEQAREMDRYVEGKKVAIANLKELLRETDGRDFIDPLETTGFSGGWGYGELLPGDRKRRTAFSRGYSQIIDSLLRMKTRNDEARELAKTLQAMLTASGK
jgi:hypothetical protein